MILPAFPRTPSRAPLRLRDSLDSSPVVSLMAAIQLMCARLGMVTGCGLASVIRTRYSRWLSWFACALVIVANIFNIGADLGGMADAMQMITGIRAFYWTPFFTALIMGSAVLDFLPYDGANLQVA